MNTVPSVDHELKPVACASAPDISVIIATRNRARHVGACLERLAAQETSGLFTYEIVIVDNGSTDETRQVVERLAKRFPGPLRYLYEYEGRAGKPWALNTGLQDARGSLFVFTDDDILPPEGWLRALWTCVIEEQAGAVTGRVLPRWTAPRPAWLTDEVARKFGGLGCVDHGTSRRTSLANQDCRWVGGNMAIHRDVVQRIGAFNVQLLGAGGVPRGEDTDYYERCLREGVKVVYEPAALVYHQIGAERTTPHYFRRIKYLQGRAQASRMPWKVTHLVTIMPLWWYRRVLQVGLRWSQEILTRRPWVERFADELRLRGALGSWINRLQLWPRGCRSILTGRPAL